MLKLAATRVQPMWDELVAQIRGSAAVFADETSWYVGEPKWWLWVFTTPTATLYRVERNRGAEVVRETLGDDFGGMLVSDCLASYDSVDYRKHKCFAHHLRALKEQAEALATRGITSGYLAAWKWVLKQVIDTCNRRDEFSPKDWGERVLDLRRRVERLLNRSPPEAEEAKFRNRLVKQRRHLFGMSGGTGRGADQQPGGTRPETGGDRPQALLRQPHARGEAGQGNDAVRCCAR